MTEAPSRRASTAAEKPDGPPPTTTTSARATTVAEPGSSWMRFAIEFSEVKLTRSSRHDGRVPANDQPLDHGDGEEEEDRERGTHNDCRVEERRIEIVGGLDDQGPDAHGRTDPLAHNRSDHRRRGCN